MRRVHIRMPRAGTGNKSWRRPPALVTGALVATVAATVMVLPTGQAVPPGDRKKPSLSYCPPQGANGTEPAACSSLSNSDIHPQRPMPNTVYRGDARDPSVIFEQGFRSRGQNYDLAAHVANPPANTGYISTSGSLTYGGIYGRRSAEGNARGGVSANCGPGRPAIQTVDIPGVGRVTTFNCANGGVTALGWRYNIDANVAANALNTDDQLGYGSSTDIGEQEWAYADAIPARAIRSVTPYRITARYTDNRLLVPGTLRYVELDDIPNPNYRSSPEWFINQDPNATFNYNTDLHIPPCIEPTCGKRIFPGTWPRPPKGGPGGSGVNPGR